MSKRSSNSTGLRFLWIPGKKKHQHKGRYDTTNKQNSQSSHHQKKLEPWSLGGSKGHSELIKSEDLVGESSGLTVPSSLGAIGSAVGGASAANISLHHSSEQVNGNAPTQPIDLEVDHDLHNTFTLLASEKRNGIQRKNLDSIERFDDHNIDDVDATKLSYLDLPKVPFHGGSTVGVQNTNNSKSNKNNDDDDCTVKCLYYALMCCECTIS